ncbi:hypothetical protein CB0940_07294 [Cercospora beticola]|uniref:Uncharacterized protein n=1 Tax=Cercospora beticola TaxID=122368 RepID=A0A2G5H850_CERBT|nr:hypothetical protein CB0940_07294 [Cercospora beticola]PIA88701.1 hypothetical protein CB0940_07294 [Cercospora beticola]
MGYAVPSQRTVHLNAVDFVYSVTLCKKMPSLIIMMLSFSCINHLKDTGSTVLLNLKALLLLISILARGRVDNLLAVVSVNRSSVVVLDLVLEVQLVGVLLDVCVESLSFADIAALDVVGALQVAGALDVCWRNGWVVFGGARDGEVEVVVAADCAAEDEVGDFEGAWEVGGVGLALGWCCCCDRGQRGGEDSRVVHFVGFGMDSVVVEMY